MGGCATKHTKLQALRADTEEEKEEEEAGAVEVVKEVVQVQTKEIEGARKSLSLLFMESKKENMEDDMKESVKFGVAVEQKPAQIIEEEFKLLTASQDQKNAVSVISITT